MKPRLLPRGGQGIIAGDTGIGKTWLCLNIVRSLCLGQDLFGNPEWPVVKSRVLFVEPEVRWTMRERMNFVFYGRDFWEPDPETPDPLPFDYLWPPPGLDLRLPDYREWFKEAIASAGYDLVVLDSLSRFMSYKENDNSDIRDVLEELRYMQGEKAAMLWTQHFGKSGDPEVYDPLSLNNIRGASKWLNDVDLITTLARKPGALTTDITHQSWLNRLSWKKVRHSDAQMPDCNIAFNRAKDGRMQWEGIGIASSAVKGKVYF